MPRPRDPTDPSAERWRPVTYPGYGHLYEVSDLGRVRSLRGRRPRILSTHQPTNRYDLARLSHPDHPGIPIQRGVHQLVARAFIGPPPFDGAIVRHLDGDTRNNHVTNLAWGSQADNAADRRRHVAAGVRPPHAGRRFGPEAARRVRARHTAGESLRSIARDLGVSPGLIHSVVHRTRAYADPPPDLARGAGAGHS